MEWGMITLCAILVAATTFFFCAGLMGDKSWFLVFVGFCFAFTDISIFHSLFEDSVVNGFTAIGISLVVAVLTGFWCYSIKDEKMNPWDF